MIWRTSTGANVKHVALQALYPPNATRHTALVVTLYLTENTSAGGTAFLTYSPGPCDMIWVMGSDSNTLLVVGYTLALTYNVTVTTTGS